MPLVFGTLLWDQDTITIKLGILTRIWCEPTGIGSGRPQGSSRVVLRYRFHVVLGGVFQKKFGVLQS